MGGCIHSKNWRKKPCSAKADLEFFYEKVFDGYTSSMQINSVVPDTLQLALRRDLIAFDRTAARSLAEAVECGSGTMVKAGESSVHSSRRLSIILMSADRSFGNFIALSSHAGYTGYLFVSEKTDSSCVRCEGLHGQVLSLDELAEKDIIPPLQPTANASYLQWTWRHWPCIIGIERASFVSLTSIAAVKTLMRAVCICLYTTPLMEFQCGR